MPLPGLGRLHEGFLDLEYLDPFRTQDPHQYFGAQGGNAGPPPLGFSITGPPSYDRYRQHHCCSLYQQTGWDPFLHLVIDGSGFVSMASNSRYSHQGQTYYGLSKCDSRPIISAEPAHHNRVASSPRNSEPFGTWQTPAVDMYTTVYNMHLPQFMEPRELAIDALSQEQERSMYMFPPSTLLSKDIQKRRTTQEGEMILIAPQAAGFSKEVPRLVAAPRRPSTNKMNADRWLRFAHWAIGQGIDRLVLQLLK